MVSWYLDLFSGKGSPPKLVTNHLANLMVSIPQVPKYHPKKIVQVLPLQTMDVATPETLEAQDYPFEKVGGCEGVPMKRYCRDHILIFLRWHLLGWGYV